MTPPAANTHARNGITVKHGGRVLPLSYKCGTTCESLGSSTRCPIGSGTGWHRMNEAALGRFEDKRREDLGAVLLDAVESKRTLCIHSLAEDRNQTIRFNNFLANPAVSTHEMLVTAGRKTNQCAAGRHVLAIMDTTDVLFPSQKANKQGFGLGSDGEHPGLFLHPVPGEILGAAHVDQPRTAVAEPR